MNTVELEKVLKSYNEHFPNGTNIITKSNNKIFEVDKLNISFPENNFVLTLKEREIKAV